jgi:hypothetical protein
LGRFQESAKPVDQAFEQLNGIALTFGRLANVGILGSDPMLLGVVTHCTDLAVRNQSFESQTPS